MNLSQVDVEVVQVSVGSSSESNDLGAVGNEVGEGVSTLTSDVDSLASVGDDSDVVHNVSSFPRDLNDLLSRIEGDGGLLSGLFGGIRTKMSATIDDLSRGSISDFDTEDIGGVIPDGDEANFGKKEGVGEDIVVVIKESSVRIDVSGNDGFSESWFEGSAVVRGPGSIRGRLGTEAEASSTVSWWRSTIGGGRGTEASSTTIGWRWSTVGRWGSTIGWGGGTKASSICWCRTEERTSRSGMVYIDLGLRVGGDLMDVSVCGKDEEAKGGSRRCLPLEGVSSSSPPSASLALVGSEAEAIDDVSCTSGDFNYVLIVVELKDMLLRAVAVSAEVGSRSDIIEVCRSLVEELESGYVFVGPDEDLGDLEARSSRKYSVSIIDVGLSVSMSLADLVTSGTEAAESRG